jgi:hypothetical protein
MFTEILKIIPKLDGKDLAAMERSLSSRFVKIAKGFGKGMLTAIKGGGLIGTATFIIDKVLNPLQQVQESLDRSLQHGDDLATFAKQFNTTAGNLARLEAFGKSSGLDAEGLRFLLVKFQGAVTQAAANPDQQTAVSAFVNRKDTAEAFFEFVQAMQKLTPMQRNFVQQEVFGERQIGKASEFLNQDFAMLNRMIGGPSAEQLTMSAEKLGALNDLKDLLTAKRELNDLQTKASLIGPHAIAGLNDRANFDLQRENKNLSSFERLERLQVAADRIVSKIESAFTTVAPMIAPFLEAVPRLADRLGVLAGVAEKSRVVRGIVPGAGKDN